MILKKIHVSNTININKKGSYMIKNKKELNEYLATELKFYGYNEKSHFFLGGCVRERDILAKQTYLLRKTEYYMNTNKKIKYIVYKARLLKYQNKYCIHIPLNVCGKGLKMLHVGPILINPNTIIGENLSLHINTVIAANGHDSKAPRIGNNCVISVGSTVLGGINIPNGIVIGANSVVLKSISEDNIAIAGNPAKKISDNGKNTWELCSKK